MFIYLQRFQLVDEKTKIVIEYEHLICNLITISHHFKLVEIAGIITVQLTIRVLNALNQSLHLMHISFA